METERLILRPFCMDDLEQIYHNCWSKEEVGLNRVYAYHATDNPASGEVMKKMECSMKVH